MNQIQAPTLIQNYKKGDRTLIQNPVPLSLPPPMSSPTNLMNWRKVSDAGASTSTLKRGHARGKHII
jgi:hypothetical protein